jgi:hypothetical protein
MRYLLLIYTNEAEAQQATPAEQEEMNQAYFAFGQAAKDSILGGEALMPTADATTVRLREGQTMITDGPYTETKEQLGGYYLVQCVDLDEAIALAAKIPGARTGAIEVRPIMEFS